VRKIKLLHLEDSAPDSELLVSMLESIYSLEVVRVDSEEAFRSALQQRDLDLVISDFTLPSYSGAAALTAARTDRPELPFIFFSGTLGEEAAIDALRAGATDYILKSRPQKMLAAIERALREADERKRLKVAEQELEQNRERFRTLIENALDVITVLDREGNFTYNSPSIERVLGYSPDELKSVNAFSIVHPDDLTTAHESFAAALKEPNASITAEVRVKHKDGSWRILELRGKGLMPGGSVEGVVINSRDVTEKRQTEAQLLRAQRMECLGILAGGIAHDLNNILAPVLMGTELLKMTVSQPDALRILDTIQASSLRGSDLVKHVLSFARGIKGEPAMLDVRPLVQEIVKLLRDTLPKNIQFQVKLPADLENVVCNPTELHQVIMNLCVNARDAMPEGGLLQIKGVNIPAKLQKGNASADARNYVRLTIRDSGTGIPAEVLPHIFEPFFTTKEEGKGTGLGLSTVLSIVKRNEGSIDVESTTGEGTTFHVLLPAADAAQRGVCRQNIVVPAGHGERILVVDDESAILEITRVILENANYEVTVASNGLQALRTTHSTQQPWDLVITDASMPIMDGPSLIKELRQVNAKLPIICTTGEISGTLLERARGAGVEAILSKPYTSNELLATVAEILRRKV
jgi:two-component system, cell cycle sensor histidine kinase and response regulator CckA